MATPWGICKTKFKAVMRNDPPAMRNLQVGTTMSIGNCLQISQAMYLYVLQCTINLLTGDQMEMKLRVQTSL